MGMLHGVAKYIYNIIYYDIYFEKANYGTTMRRRKNINYNIIYCDLYFEKANYGTTI